MNKTIIININGTVFHIEEDAYEILKSYMTDVKRHFLNSADSHEITTDIENRIAEMFSEILLRDEKQVIIEQDVKQVVEQMGTVQDFENAENGEEAGSNNYTYNNTGSRTLFRDPDDHLLGGVCAGLANYFDIQAVWVRLIFALAVLFFGTGFFLYVILWIVIPRAITRADRMAMKGEKLNLQGFKNSFEEEFGHMRNHLTNLQAEARPLVYKLRDFAGEFFHHLGVFIKSIGQILIKLLGVFILLICLSAAIGLTAVLGMLTIWTEPQNHMFPFSIMTYEYATRIYIAGFVICLVPVIALFLITLKSIFKTRAIDSAVASVMFVIWLFAVGVGIYYGTKVASNFRSSASFSQTLSLNTASKNTYYLKLNDVKYFTKEDSVRLDMKAAFKDIVVNNENDFEDAKQNNMTLRIEKSDVSKPALVVNYKAKGKYYEDALLNARNTKYLFSQQDSVLTFDRYLQLLKNAPWRDQQVELTLKVPVNAVVIIEDKLDDFLRDGINLYECKQKNKLPNNAPAPFIMTVNGLECKVDTLIAPKPDSLKTIKAK